MRARNGDEFSVGIIGDGPSAILLSYLLSGNVPYYDPEPFGPHPDSTLDSLLGEEYVYPHKSLLEAVNDTRITEYLRTSYSSFYSSEMLAINLLVDTLVSSDETSYLSLRTKQTRIKFVKDASRQVSHRVFGRNGASGGQWASDHPEIDDPAHRCLSYAEMLSLPEYTFTQFYLEAFSTPLPDFYRPTRAEVSQYYALYPSKVGIEHNFVHHAAVTDVSPLPKGETLNGEGELIRVTYEDGGNAKSVVVSRVVLATGIFERQNELDYDYLQRPDSLAFQDFITKLTQLKGDAASTVDIPSYTVVPPLATPPDESDYEALTNDVRKPTLVLGSGVSAAEAVDKCLQNHVPVIHIYKWDTKTNTCPLRKFPRELYPEYHRVFRLMKQYASNCCEEFSTPNAAPYLGLANASVIDMSSDGRVLLRAGNGAETSHKVGLVKVRTGRFGSLAFLSPDILYDGGIASKRVKKYTIRTDMSNSSQGTTFELGKSVYAIGSLTGDTLVRFLHGGCLYVASKLFA
ncbi:hypothetical protein TRVA0_066S00386 [Trichomonascus vanleenenianus]|uniref:uncharacterized protein n=1 Tax=Trichomonascus vanleenenianus TaxID=2268995 RepID=UPI003EC9728C